MNRAFALEDLACSVRYGFATNSSSTHSICLLPKPPSGDSVGRWTATPEKGAYYFQTFSRTTPEAKADYLCCDMEHQVFRIVAPTRSWLLPDWKATGLDDEAMPDVDESSHRFARAYTSATFGVEAPSGGDIDHQSCFSFPLDKNLPHVGFARWYFDRVVNNPRVVIFGGHDGKKSPAKPKGTVEVGLLPHDEYQHPLTCHDRGDHWLLWGKTDGTKLRIPKVDGVEIRHTTIPELVDLKITDFCNVGCAFCYQGSTGRGEHTQVDTYALKDLLVELGVREVALGGGEPTDWPDLYDFVVLAAEKFVVNLTTRRPEKLSKAVWGAVGSVGFSCERAEDLQSAVHRLKIMGVDVEKKLVAHVILGATPLDEAVAILKLAEENEIEVLLLGYKTDGRGAAFAPHDHAGWVARLRSEFFKNEWWAGPKLGIDTKLAQEYGPNLTSQLGVQPKWMVGEEGAFSLYIDVVSMTFAKSSYGAQERFDLPPAEQGDYSWGDKAAKVVLETFRSWHT